MREPQHSCKSDCPTGGFYTLDPRSLFPCSFLGPKPVQYPKDRTGQQDFGTIIYSQNGEQVRLVSRGKI